MIPPDLKRKAETEMLKNTKEKNMKVLGEAAAMLRAEGLTVEAQSLEDRAHAISKTQSADGHGTRLFLKARAIQRSEQELAEQQAAAREDARLKELDKAYRLAREETAGKRADAGAAAAEARAKKAEVEAQRKSARERAELKKTNLAYMQQHLAADLVAKALEFLQDPTHGAKRAAAARSLADDYKKWKGWEPIGRAVLDAVWEATARTGYTMTTPAAAVGKGKPKAPKEWASERMARALYGGREPREAKTAEATYSRLNRLISGIAPGYDHTLFRGMHMGADLLSRYGHNVDLCIIAALRRYCQVVPADKYPCAIRNWPWSEDQEDSWVTAHKAESSARAKDQYRPTKVAEKKSLSSAEATPIVAPPLRLSTAGAAPAKRPRTEAAASSSSSSSAASISWEAKWSEPP